MSYDDTTGNWPAIYFLKEDLKKEKSSLIDDMSELTLEYWGGTDPLLDEMLKDITARCEVINRALINIESGAYSAPEG